MDDKNKVGETEINEHHIWCNYFWRSRQGCKMCEGLFKDYPSDGMTSEELAAIFFPEAIIRK